MDHPEKGRMKKMTPAEEREFLEHDPTALELLELLKDQSPERTDQLISELSTLAEKEDTDETADE
jgi:hypothetical protein